MCKPTGRKFSCGIECDFRRHNENNHLSTIGGVNLWGEY